MNAIERLKDSVVRVEALVSFYQGHLSTTLDTVELITPVTIKDLKILLEGLADRDISIKHLKPTEVEIEMAKQSILDQESWLKGYDRGYKAGRDGELKKIKERLNFLLGQIDD